MKCSALCPQEQKDKIVTAKGVIYLEDSETTINGIRIWGSPWQPEFGRWMFNLPTVVHEAIIIWD